MRRIQEHNREVMYSAEYRANEMQVFPSKLEERMIDLLNIYNVEYEFQKIFYIYADDGWIIRYYIADFYIPSSNLIIEVDGKFHDKQKQHDKNRTKEIQSQYPDIEVFRWRWGDFKDEDKMEELRDKIWG